MFSGKITHRNKRHMTRLSWWLPGLQISLYTAPLWDNILSCRSVVRESRGINLWRYHPLKTNIFPKNWCLGDDVPLNMVPFQGYPLVRFPGCGGIGIPSLILWPLEAAETLLSPESPEKNGNSNLRSHWIQNKTLGNFQYFLHLGVATSSSGGRREKKGKQSTFT